MTTYNGWTNYATWRVNLLMFDGMSPRARISAYDLGRGFKDYAEEVIELSSEPGFARDYALEFLSDVNWSEIARHYVDEESEEGEAA